MDLQGFFNWLGDQLNNILSFICFLLPDSPFHALSYSPIGSIIGYINYFVPIDFAIDVLTLWGAAIVIYYGYQIVLRWAKAIG